MRAYIVLMLLLQLVASIAPQQAEAQEPPVTKAEESPVSSETELSDSTIVGVKPKAPVSPEEGAPDWLFPVDTLNKTLLPDWVHIGGQLRARFEGPTGVNFTTESDDYLLYRFRLNATLEPKTWLKFRFELQDARAFWNHLTLGLPYVDTFTLWEAYAQLGNSEQGLGDVLAGRQVLLFGDERVIGPSNWTNVGRTFDVARIDLHSQPSYKVSLFLASVVPGDSNELHNSLGGNNMYGLYGSLKSLIPNASFEPYILWRLAPSNPLLFETLGRGHLSEVTLGLHWKGSLPADLDYDSELNYQCGSLGTSSINAWALYAHLGKSFPDVIVTPYVFLEFNYASGTNNLAGHQWNTFDQIYPSNHDKYGFADQVGRRNLVQYRVSVEESPAKGWKMKQAWAGFYLANTNDNFYNDSGAIEVPAHPGASPHIGNELDLVFEYTWGKGLNFGFGFARLFAGEFLKTAATGHSYSYPYAYVQYNFSKSGFHFPVTPNQPYR